MIRKKALRNILIEMITYDLSFYQTRAYRYLQEDLIENDSEYSDDKWAKAEKEGDNVYMDSFIDKTFELIKRELLGLSQL